MSDTKPSAEAIEVARSIDDANWDDPDCMVRELALALDDFAAERVTREVERRREAEARLSWQPINAAPRDGTLMVLLVDYGEAGLEGHPVEDATLARTIGHNNFDNDGEDRWHLAGWCWCHDHYVQGNGKPVAWMPLPEVPDDALVHRQGETP